MLQDFCPDLSKEKRDGRISVCNQFAKKSRLSYHLSSHLSPWQTKALLSSAGLSSFRARQPRHVAPAPSTSSSPTTIPSTPSRPPPPSHQPLSASGSREASTCLETKMLENCVTKAVGHRADCCHCSALPLKISSASSYTSSCSLKHPRPTLNAHRL